MMKKNILLIVLISGFLLSSISCKKTVEEVIVEVVGSMSAVIDGNPWEATLASQVGVRRSNFITIAGFSTGGEKIFISIRGTTVGVYTFGLVELSAQTYAIFYKSKDDETDGTKKYLTTQGTVNITEITDKRITGTFSFSAINTASPPETIQITNGIFKNVYYKNI